MRAIKALVIGMGVLIVAGLILLGYGFYSNVAKINEDGEDAAPPPSIAATDFGEIAVPVPPGARVAEMVATGGRVVLRLEAPEGPDRLLVFDPQTGTVTGRLELIPGPASGGDSDGDGAASAGQ